MAPQHGGRPAARNVQPVAGQTGAVHAVVHCGAGPLAERSGAQVPRGSESIDALRLPQSTRPVSVRKPVISSPGMGWQHRASFTAMVGSPSTSTRGSVAARGRGQLGGVNAKVAEVEIIAAGIELWFRVIAPDGTNVSEPL